MAFAAGARTWMSDVTAGIVLDDEPRRLEVGKFIADSFGDRSRHAINPLIP